MFNFRNDETLSILEKQRLREKVGQTYREYYVLITYIGSAYKWFVLHLEIVMVTAMVLCLSACTKIPDPGVSIRLGVIGFVGTTVFLSLFSSLADVHERFEAMTSSWRKLHLQDTWMKQFLRSVKPRGIMVGSYFEVDKGLVMTLAGIIVDNTVSAMML